MPRCKKSRLYEYSYDYDWLINPNHEQTPLFLQLTVSLGVHLTLASFMGAIN